MRNRWIVRWVLALLTASLVLLAFHRYGMGRAMTIDASSGYVTASFDDRGLGGDSVAVLQNSGDALNLRCDLHDQYAWPFCAFSIIVADGEHGIDLTSYDTIDLDVAISGPEALPIKVYLRNYNPAYSSAGNPDTLKVNELQYTPANEHNPLSVPLKYFVVASWWLSERGISPLNAAPELDRVAVIQLATGDNARPGSYLISVRAITFHGRWLTQAQVLALILGLWVLSAVVYLGAVFVRAHHAVHNAKSEKEALAEINAALMLERDELEALATHDALTGVLNRVGLRNHLYALASRAKSGDTMLSAIFIDIDHFKAINDRMGHMTGDAVLREFAELIIRNSRAHDVLCRWGGEEFIMLCPDTNLHAAGTAAEKLRVLVERHAWPEDASVRSSFGVTQMLADEDVSQFLKRADAALYQAKTAGRNRVALDHGNRIELRPTHG